MAALLHAFNVEFDTPSPGPDVLAPRLRRLLAGDATVALLAGSPTVGFALVTLRPNVWYDGEVALLDELYVVPERRSEGAGAALLAHLGTVVRPRGVSRIEIGVDEGDVDAQRFYRRHGFTEFGDDGTGERSFWFCREDVV